MAPNAKGKNNKAQQSAAAPEATSTPPPPAPKTIGEKLQAEYIASRPYHNLYKTKGGSNLTDEERKAYTKAIILEDGLWRRWPDTKRKEFLAACKKSNIPVPLSPPRDLGVDRTGRPIAEYSLEEYRAYEQDQDKLAFLKHMSYYFKRKVQSQEQFERRSSQRKTDEPVEFEPPVVTEEEVKQEKDRRGKICAMGHGKKVGKYAGDPAWDDVKPIPQDDGKNPLAAIAYTDEYAEAISYLRAIMATKEHSSRVLELTAHVISLNPAHYTVWLYRATTLFALKASITDELDWVKTVALANQKNYQVWHHRQLLITNIMPTLSTREEVIELAKSEQSFLATMFEDDAKNYHVWSYRQFLVRTLSLFPSQTSDIPQCSELDSIEALIQEDVRNNSAWSHRFFLVFSDPKDRTPKSKATERDPMIPESIIDREIEFSKSAIFRAPENQSPWNYLRGVLRKGGRPLKELSCFAEEFCDLGGDGQENVRSSHALDFLADAWATEGDVEKAQKAWGLLANKYDRIRKNYWEWKSESFTVIKA